MTFVSNPLKRSAWAVFLYRGKQVASYILRESKLGDRELMLYIPSQRIFVVMQKNDKTKF